MTEIELLRPTKIIRSKRRSICLTIDMSNNFIVRAPIKATDKEIFKFIAQKAGWIIDKRTQHIVDRKYMPIQIKDGETLQILGETFSIKLVDKKVTKCENNLILVPKENSQQSLILFLKRTLKQYLNVRLNELSIAHNLPFKSVSISSAKTNWGSCSFNNKLHFSYKLVMCPKMVVDYIILHELTHTKIKNHSKEFYIALGRICPEFKQHEKWLKDNREIVTVI